MNLDENYSKLNCSQSLRSSSEYTEPNSAHAPTRKPSSHACGNAAAVASWAEQMAAGLRPGRPTDWVTEWLVERLAGTERGGTNYSGSLDISISTAGKHSHLENLFVCCGVSALFFISVLKLYGVFLWGICVHSEAPLVFVQFNSRHNIDLYFYTICLLCFLFYLSLCYNFMGPCLNSTNYFEPPLVF